jgi:flagellar biosynthesis protein FlhA
MTFEPTLEQTLVSRVKRSQFDIGLLMDPSLTEGIITEIEPKIREMSDRGLTPILVTTAELRLAFRRFMEPSFPQLIILAYQELPSETHVEPFAAIALEDKSLPPEIVSAMENDPNIQNQPQVAA